MQFRSYVPTQQWVRGSFKPTFSLTIEEGGFPPPNPNRCLANNEGYSGTWSVIPPHCLDSAAFSLGGLRKGTLRNMSYWALLVINKIRTGKTLSTMLGPTESNEKYYRNLSQ